MVSFCLLRFAFFLPLLFNVCFCFLNEVSSHERRSVLNGSNFHRKTSKLAPSNHVNDDSLLTSVQSRTADINSSIIQKPKIFVTNKVLYSILKSMLNGLIELDGAYKSGQHFHNVSITPSLAHQMSSSDLVIYSCRDLEPNIHRLVGNLQQTNFFELCNEVKRYAPNGVLLDGHIWTTPQSSIWFVLAIRDKLITMYPKWKNDINDRCNALITNLQRINHRYKKNLSDKKCNAMSFGIHSGYYYLNYFYPNIKYQGEISFNMENGFLPLKLQNMVDMNKENSVCLFIESGHVGFKKKINDKLPLIKVAELDIDGDNFDRDSDYTFFFDHNLKKLNACLCHVDN